MEPEAVDDGRAAATESDDRAAAHAEQTATVPGLAEALALARESLIAAHPDAVPELILGETAAELRASVSAARAAFARAREAARAELAAAVVSPGAPGRAPEAALATLPAVAKIALGVRRA